MSYEGGRLCDTCGADSPWSKVCEVCEVVERNANAHAAELARHKRREARLRKLAAGYRERAKRPRNAALSKLIAEAHCVEAYLSDGNCTECGGEPATGEGCALCETLRGLKDAIVMATPSTARDFVVPSICGECHGGLQGERTVHCALCSEERRAYAYSTGNADGRVEARSEERQRVFMLIAERAAADLKDGNLIAAAALLKAAAAMIEEPTR